MDKQFIFPFKCFVEGTDFSKLDMSVNASSMEPPKVVIATMARKGIQPPRHFSVHLHQTSSSNNKTIINGTVVITILDNSGIFYFLLQ